MRVNFVSVLVIAVGVIASTTDAPGFPSQNHPPLRVIPFCGSAGDSIYLEGVNWSSVPCEGENLRVAFDDSLITGSSVGRDDFLIGAIVPYWADPGVHQIRVTLATEDSTLACTMVDFTVLDMTSSPLAFELNPIITPNNEIVITYDASQSCQCDCKEVAFIQSVMPFVLSSVDTTSITYTELFENADPRRQVLAMNLDRMMYDQRIRLDVMPKSKDLRYPGFSNPKAGRKGIKRKEISITGRSLSEPEISMKQAKMKDSPSRHWNDFPDGSIGFYNEYETNVFCFAGRDRGKWYGTLTWKWKLLKASVPIEDDAYGVIFDVVVSLPDSKSEDFTNAYNKYLDIDEWSAKTVYPESFATGGRKCVPVGQSGSRRIAISLRYK